MRILLFIIVLAVSAVVMGCGKAPCSASTCASGCCDAAGVCQVGSQPLSCGIAGGTCATCMLGQQCLQGNCFGGNATGGGNGGGAGGGTGGGTTGIRLIPTSATVPYDSRLELAAELTGSAPDQLINWSIESGGGSIASTGPSTASYLAYSANATVRIRAQANYLSSIATFADLTIAANATPIQVEPHVFSATPYVVALGSRQTFGAARYVFASPSSNYLGLRNVSWTVWPSGTITDGTLTATSTMQRVYARETTTNIWASVNVSGETTTLPSVEVTPSLTSVAPNGVVQFTANISTGAAADWTVVTAGGGTISTSGTYTAPSTPGVYVVIALAAGSGGLRGGVATVIVQ